MNRLTHFCLVTFFLGGIAMFPLVGCGGPLSGIKPIQQAAPGEPAYVVGIPGGKFANEFDFLRSAPYLQIGRTVEMHAFAEKSDASGAVTSGSEWTGDPDLKVDERPACAGKQNRRSYVPNRALWADLTITGADGKVWSVLSGWSLKDLPAYTVQPGDIVENQRLISHNEYFYFNQYCIDAPQPECERLIFKTTRVDPGVEYIVVGAATADGASIGPFVDEKGERHFYIAPLAHLSEIAK